MKSLKTHLNEAILSEKSYEKSVGTKSNVSVTMRLMKWAKANNNWIYARIRDAADGNTINQFNSNRVVKMFKGNGASLAGIINKNNLGDSLKNDWFSKLGESEKVLARKEFKSFLDGIKDHEF